MTTRRAPRLQERLFDTLQGMSATPPATCANGHPLGAGQVLVAWLPCTCAGADGKRGHLTASCRACDAVWYDTPHTDDTATVW
jgi:hypothetical protein